MTLLGFGATAALVTASAISLAAQRPGVEIDRDDVTIRGCVMRAERYSPIDKMPLIWSRNDVLISLAGAEPRRAAEGDVAGRLFYWLDDEDMADHVGRMVVITGDLKDVEKGEFEIERKDDYTTLELKFDGRTEKARLPTPWFAAPRGTDEREYDVVVQRVDVDDVKVIGTCER